MRITKMTRGLGGHSPSNIMQHLKGIDFPAKKQDLEKQARENGAQKEVLEVLEDLPDETYNSAADVMKAFGDEERGGEEKREQEAR
jgi:hypothetical protein